MDPETRNPEPETRNPIERSLGAWGAYAAAQPRRVLLGAALLSVLLAPFAWRAVTHLDANLFHQASGSLPRFRILREINEAFGGDVVAAAVTLAPEGGEDSVPRLSRSGPLVNTRGTELRKLGDLLSAEMERIGTTPEDFAALPDNLQKELRQEPWLRHVECRTGQGLEQALKRIAAQRPYVVLTPDDVATLKQKFEPAALAAALERVANTLAALPPNSAEKERLREDPLDILETGKQTLAARLNQRKQALAHDAQGYFISPDGSTLLVLARTALPSSRLDFDRALAAALERAKVRALDALNPEPETRNPKPDPFTIGFTGLPVISAQNEQSVRTDLLVNTATSFLAVLALFLIIYRSVTLTWDVTWTTALIILWTVAVGGLVHGRLSLLGGAFTAVPLGLGTDYTILVYNTFLALRQDGTLGVSDAMRRTLIRCGPSIVTAAGVTAIAFFGIGFTHLTGLADFGFLGGVSALLGGAVVLLVLPAALCLPGRSSVVGRRSSVTARPLTFGVPAWGRILERKSSRTGALVAGVLVIACGVALIFFGPDPGPETVAGVRFDPELGHLRSLHIPALPLRQELARKFGLGLADLRVLITAADEESAFAAKDEVTELLAPYVKSGELKHEDTVLDFIPSAAQQRENMAALKSFDTAAAIAAFQAAAVKRFGPKGLVFFKPFLKQLSEFSKLARESSVLTLGSLMDGPLANFLAPNVARSVPRVLTSGPLLNSRGTEAQPLRLALAWFPTRLDLPESFYDDVAAKLEHNPPAGVSVRVTAARMVGFELKRSVLADCGWITATVAVCAAVMLALALRSVAQVLLAAVPLLFAYVFMLAGVPLAQAVHYDYSLNFVNLMMFPLLLGSAIDYGLYLVFDAYSPRKPGLAALMSGTGCSVLYCIGTTLIAFGSFVTSSYTGLISMGVASLFGYTGAVFGAMIVLPAILGTIRSERRA